MTDALQRFTVSLLILTASARLPAAEQAKLKSTSVEVRCAEGEETRSRHEAVNLELLLLPAGKITLKGEGRPDEEHVIKPVWMSKYEIRWDDYDIFWLALDETSRQRMLDSDRHKLRVYPPDYAPWGGWYNGQYWKSSSDGDYPANCIHFQAAKRYCAWLSKYTGKKFRLPTEAEWEYACRAGGPPVKLDAIALREVAWFNDNADDLPHAVGTKKPNAWGFYDMLGNVGEFVIRDPKDDKGLLAGGSWRDEAKNVWSGAREPYSREWQSNDPEVPPTTSWLNWSVHHVGFRVVMEE
jgi:formylglycine-generating enzyme required for sulfatase activity